MIDDADPATQHLSTWLTLTGRHIAEPREFIPAFVAEIEAVGIPVLRLSLSIRTIHPELIGATLLWTRETGFEEIPRSRDAVTQTVFLESPIYQIYAGHTDFIRRRLCDPASPRDFSILENLAGMGATDYLILAVPFTDRARSRAFAIATDRPEGFSESEVATLRAIMPLLGMMAEIQSTRSVAASLLSVYLGNDAGARVLSGEVTRGSGETIEAAILYADMRGFTELSERTPSAGLIEILNRYFECMAGPVDEFGGEVLKFMGDGMLAIFPIGNGPNRDGDARHACRVGLAAASTGLRRLERYNAERAVDGEAPIRAGVTFHLGEVIYGNIGAAQRLDFTVIGRAVNLVSRMQTVLHDIEHPILLSEIFAQRVGTDVVPVGKFKLRGITEPQYLFAPSPLMETEAA
ncbi:MAG TPA: adenylate/guanylate cyclase domain-containing protein [Stellaceae bacterium]|nr:adenylate/guanylate cyclase domain-containing protein [Stellaceae bacterium]